MKAFEDFCTVLVSGTMKQQKPFRANPDNEAKRRQEPVNKPFSDINKQNLRQTYDKLNNS